MFVISALRILIAAILLYDYILTFGREVELFWKWPRRTFPFVLFIASRYLMVLGIIPTFLLSFRNLPYKVGCG